MLSTGYVAARLLAKTWISDDELATFLSTLLLPLSLFSICDDNFNWGITAAQVAVAAVFLFH